MNLYILHNRRTPLQATEALGPISIPRGFKIVERDKIDILNTQIYMTTDFSGLVPEQQKS